MFIVHSERLEQLQNVSKKRAKRSLLEGTGLKRIRATCGFYLFSSDIKLRLLRKKRKKSQNSKNILTCGLDPLPCGLISLLEELLLCNKPVCSSIQELDISTGTCLFLPDFVSVLCLICILQPCDCSWISTLTVTHSTLPRKQILVKNWTVGAADSFKISS